MITTRLVQDGNSMAVRLSKPVLEMSGLSGELELEVKRGKIIISAKHNPRAGWHQAIKQELEAHGPLDARDEYGDLDEQSEATLSDGLI